MELVVFCLLLWTATLVLQRGNIFAANGRINDAMVCFAAAMHLNESIRIEVGRR